VLSDDALLDGAPLEGALLAPLAALPLGWLGVELELELDAPPEAELGGVAGVVGVALEELEELSRFDASTETEPDGLLGVVVEPADEDAAPEGGVVRDTARSPASWSQPAIRPAPSARETATARVDSFMNASLVGVGLTEQGTGLLT
jgi:hypothetical protein